ncbi:MAG TPA: type II toxin-antitoxin system VapC family toxin [Nanoarchaeota archaeon]|nr:type II toxin-antitoxin system VapC family toxin [Nanoarchaeota archaeon]
MQKRYFHFVQDLASPHLARYYLDTCIWKDYYENRSDRLRPIGEWALAFINKAVEEGSRLLYSDAVIRELNRYYTMDKTDAILSIVRNEDCLEKVSISRGQAQEARELSRKHNVPFGDALHAVLARDNNAIIVTRDRHFDELRDIAEARKPEELI